MEHEEEIKKQEEKLEELNYKEKCAILEERIGLLFGFFKQQETDLNNFRKGGKFTECPKCRRINIKV